MHVKLTEVREARDTRLASGKVILSFPPISKRDFAETKKKKEEATIDNSPEGNYEIGIMNGGQSNWNG